MKRVFVSYKFRDRDEEIARQVKQLIESHDLSPSDGRYLAGGLIDDEVDTRLKEADALVALFLLPNDPGDDFSWLLTEFTQARATGRPCIAIFENGFKPFNALARRQYLNLEPKEPLRAFLDLSTTIGQWKRNAGRSVRVRLNPLWIADELLTPGSGAACTYRVEDREGNRIREGRAEPRELDKGLVIFNAAGVPEEHKIFVEAVVGALSFTCRVDPEVVPVELVRRSRS